MDLKLNIDEYLPLREVVFNTLRSAIVHGEFEPGERLMEVTLAKRLGVSRTPVREAIRMLELEGLVVMMPRRGAEVARITEKDLKDALEIRMALEELAAGLACARIDDDGRKNLREACARFREAVVKKNLNEIVDADVAFHNVIYDVTDNKRLVGMFQNLRKQVYRYRVEYLKDSSYHTKLAEEHEALTDAISRGDVDMAREVTIKHIYDQEKIVIANAVKSSDT